VYDEQLSAAPPRGCRMTPARSDSPRERSLQVHDWQAIVKDYGATVWQTAYRLLGNRADTADCFQDTFLAAFELARAQPVRNLPGLLVRLATTRAVDRLRQRGRLQRYCAGSQAGPETVGHEPDPAGCAQTQELADRLRAAIGRLPPQEASVFCLRYLNDMSYGQIARELKVGINVVGVALYRAKARLRKALDAAPTQEDEVSREET
jgi:RNA polymerase sigma-70 factor (ECF subfamily)